MPFIRTAVFSIEEVILGSGLGSQILVCINKDTVEAFVMGLYILQYRNIHTIYFYIYIFYTRAA